MPAAAEGRASPPPPTEDDNDEDADSAAATEAFETIVRDAHNVTPVTGPLPPTAAAQLCSLSASGSGSSSPDKFEKLRKEILTLQSALYETRHELTEANEAREASEMCIGTLREFIARNNLRSGSKEGKEVHGRKKTASRWGFKPWKADSARKDGDTVSPIMPTTAPP
ncbi:hypothetical protein K438DRAFT_1979990 [Mycena galopus ATCC 62051]|nr:hypothetical protein K438DRAFT_1979990 [Mycena galopus ATCC 62051]